MVKRDYAKESYLQAVLVQSRALFKGKEQNRFVLMAASLKKFIDINEPVIEDVHVRLKRLGKQSYEKIKSSEVGESLRTDYDGAKLSLSSYNRIFGHIDHHLSMMTSNFGLRNFLIENGIAEELLPEFQRDLSYLWEATYGDLVDDYWGIKLGLDKLRGLLDKQVRILEIMPTRPSRRAAQRAATSVHTCSPINPSLHRPRRDGNVPCSPLTAYGGIPGPRTGR